MQLRKLNKQYMADKGELQRALSQKELLHEQMTTVCVYAYVCMCVIYTRMYTHVYMADKGELQSALSQRESVHEQMTTVCVCICICLCLYVYV